MSPSYPGHNFGDTGQWIDVLCRSQSPSAVSGDRDFSSPTSRILRCRDQLALKSSQTRFLHDDMVGNLLTLNVVFELCMRTSSTRAPIGPDAHHTTESLVATRGRVSLPA